MVKAPVNRVIPFSSVDGPGSRTAVFLQKCNINCRYCHNPETRNMCIGCMACVPLCPAGALKPIETENGPAVAYDSQKCTFCDTCIRTCSHGASPRIQWLSAEEVFSRVCHQMPFIRGVTVSGGECMLYPEFLTELFALCQKKGLHTLIDSNGTVPFSDHPELLAVTDGVMLDIKAFTSEASLRITDHDNAVVLENAAFLSAKGKLPEIRTVVVPGLFDVEASVRETARFLANLPGQKEHPTLYKLITYRENGVRSKYRCYTPPDSALMQKLAEVVREEGMQNVVIV